MARTLQSPNFNSKNYYIMSKTTDHVFTALLLASILATLPSCDRFQNFTDVQHVSRAKDFRDKGNLRESEIELKNALKKNPSNAEARRLLGSLYLGAGNGVAAEKELRYALDLHVAKEALILPLAEALLLQHKNTELLAEIAPLPSLSNQDQARIHAYRGNALLNIGKQQEAKFEYEKGIEKDVNNAFSKLGLARIELLEKHPNPALQIIKEILQAEPEFAQAWTLQAEIQTALNDYPQAEISYLKAIDLLRNNFTERATLALLRIQENKLDDAKKDIDLLKKEASTYFMTHYTDGLWNMAKGQYIEAVNAFEHTLNLNNDFIPADYALATSELPLGHYEQAAQHLARYLAFDPYSVKANQFMAFIKFKTKDFSGAKAQLAPVIQHFPKDIFSLKLMANIAFAMGQSSEGVEYLSKVVEADPESSQSRTSLAVGLLGMGQDDKAIEQLNKAGELNQNSIQSDAYTALIYTKNRSFDKAFDVIKKIKEKTPNDSLPYNLEGKAYMVMNDLAKAEKSFQQSLDLSPNNITALASLASLALQQKNNKQAVELYQKILKDNPKSVLTLISLSEISFSEGNLDESQKYLEQAVEAEPKSLQARIILANFYLQFGQSAKALATLNEIRTDYPSNKEFLASFIPAQLKEKDNKNALNSALELVKAAPDAALSHNLLARAYAANGDLKNTKASLDNSLRIDPNFVNSRIDMVQVLTRENKQADAQKFLSSLAAQYPKSLEVLGLQAWLHIQQQKPKEAAKIYSLILEKAPNTDIAIKLAQAQWVANENTAALATLEAWIKQHPAAAFARYIYAGFLAEINRPKDATVELQAILQQEPNNALVLNNLAWNLRSENPRKAREYAEKAVALSGKTPSFLDTLAMTLLDQKDNVRALELLEQAYSYSGAHKNPNIQYHLALAYAKNNRDSDAKKALVDLLNSTAKFQERKEAEQLLKSLSQ
jgi:putative PEP-CTERM system TPR-repeat lipoprotein